MKRRQVFVWSPQSLSERDAHAVANCRYWCCCCCCCCTGDADSYWATNRTVRADADATYGQLAAHVASARACAPSCGRRYAFLFLAAFTVLPLSVFFPIPRFAPISIAHSPVGLQRTTVGQRRGQDVKRLRRTRRRLTDRRLNKAGNTLCVVRSPNCRPSAGEKQLQVLLRLQNNSAEVSKMMARTSVQSLARRRAVERISLKRIWRCERLFERWTPAATKIGEEAGTPCRCPPPPLNPDVNLLGDADLALMKLHRPSFTDTYTSRQFASYNRCSTA